MGEVEEKASPSGQDVRRGSSSCAFVTPLSSSLSTRHAWPLTDSTRELEDERSSSVVARTHC